MDIGEAIKALERIEYNYTIHKTEIGYECLIEPKYAKGALVQARAQTEGHILALVIYAALNELTR